MKSQSQKSHIEKSKTVQKSQRTKTVKKIKHRLESRRSHLPAPQILRVLKLYYKVASSHLDTPRTKVVQQSRQFSFQLHKLLRVLKLHYKVASSHLPAPQIPVC